MSSEVSDVPPPGTAVHHDSAGGRLKGNMGTAQLVFTVLAFNAPLGIMAATVPLVIAFGSGMATPWLYVVLGVLISILAVGYTTMSRLIPRPGALYTYVTAGLGKPLGLGASFLALVVYSVGMLYTLVYVGLAVGPMVMVGVFNGPDVAWWLYALPVAVVIGVLGYLQVDVSAKVVGVLLLLEVAGLLLYDVVVISKGGATGNLSMPTFDTDAVTVSGLAVGAAFAIVSFIGFETTAVFRDEAKDPERTVPRATYIAIACVSAFYAVGSWLLIQGYGKDDAPGSIATSPGTAFFDNVQAMLGSTGYKLLIVLFVTSTFASLTTLHNVTARYLFNLGADGVLPTALGKAHPRLGSPHRASLLVSIITVGFVVVVALTRADPLTVFLRMAGATGYALVVLLSLVAIGIATYLLRTPNTGLNPWSRAIAPIIASVGMLTVLAATTKNLNFLTGSPTLSKVAIGLVLATVALAIAVALTLRSIRPEVYDRIGSDY